MDSITTKPSQEATTDQSSSLGSDQGAKNPSQLDHKD